MLIRLTGLFAFLPQRRFRPPDGETGSNKRKRYAPRNARTNKPTLLWSRLWGSVVFPGLRRPFEPPCVVLMGVEGISPSLSNHWFVFPQVRNLTLAFQAAGSIGIKPSLVS